MIQLEIACNSFASCLNAVKGGANRIELFENLNDGGCTPSPGMITLSSKLSIPIYVMIRPRGGDFCYSVDEIEIMLSDIEYCKTQGVTGIVFGCLTSNGTIDVALCKKILEHWNGPATFHRAIDRTADIFASAKVVADLGFERILSSGGQENAIKGIATLKKLNSQLSSLISIMPGAGVNALNAAQILTETGCNEIHATCKITKPSNNGNSNPHIRDEVTESALEAIRELRDTLNRI